MSNLRRIINYIRFGIRDPLAALNFVMFGRNSVNLIVLKRLGKQLGASNKLIDELYHEIRNNDKFNGYVSSALAGLNFLGWIIFPEGLYISEDLKTCLRCRNWGCSWCFFCIYIDGLRDEQ